MSESAWRHLRTPAMVTLGVVTTSSVCYVVVADFSAFDALYMTMITIATIGYGEVHPLDTAGRVWTICVIVATFILAACSAATISGLFLTGDLSRTAKAGKDRRMRDRLKNHVIVVGYGRVGRATIPPTW